MHNKLALIYAFGSFWWGKFLPIQAALVYGNIYPQSTKRLKTTYRKPDAYGSRVFIDYKTATG